VIKAPYNFDFLTLTEGYREKELEDALTDNITKFLLELGQGFAYIGR
jgi:predicted nuclease of restriction endonuclease-like (RecB) superfamily